MDVDVAVESVIPHPREVVASYAGDPSNAPEWYANIVSVRWRTPPPLAVGSKMDFEARFLGRRLAYTYVVVELDAVRILSAAGFRARRAEDGALEWRTAGLLEHDGAAR